MKFKYKKVFLTGANGWLGKQMLKTLLLGDEDVIDNFDNNNCNVTSLVYSKDTKIDFLKQFNVNHKIIKGDVRKKEDCDNFFNDSSDGILIHLAGIIHPNRVKDFFEINYYGTKNLIQSGLSKGIKKIIVMSSNSPLGCNKSNKIPFNENSPYNPYMNYGKSKMLMERYLKNKINLGFDITIIRSPWFYGDYMPERQYSFYNMIKNGKVPIIGNGKNLRSKANIKNIAQGILLISDKKISKGKIYWIADEQPYSYNEIINTIRKILIEELKIKTKKTSIKIPNFFGDIFWLIDYAFQKLGYYNQKIHVASELNKNIFCSIDLAKKELGYNPKINLYKGLKKTLNNQVKNLLE